MARRVVFELHKNKLLVGDLEVPDDSVRDNWQCSQAAGDSALSRGLLAVGFRTISQPLGAE